MVLDTKKIIVLLELIQLYKQNPLEKFFNFTIYQNYTLALTSYFALNLNVSVHFLVTHSTLISIQTISHATI